MSPAARSPRPARAGAPPLPTFESLDRGHRDILSALDELNSLLAHVGDNGPDAHARTGATRVLAFFEGPARQHHADEERMVFPGLLSSGDEELVQHVQRLRQDHGWLEEDWIELALPIRAISEGFNWYDLEMLRRALPVFTQLYQDHIALEEAVVYPAARRRFEALRTGVEHRKA